MGEGVSIKMDMVYLLKCFNLSPISLKVVKFSPVQSVFNSLKYRKFVYAWKLIKKLSLISQPVKSHYIKKISKKQTAGVISSR